MFLPEGNASVKGPALEGTRKAQGIQRELVGLEYIEGEAEPLQKGSMLVGPDCGRVC